VALALGTPACRSPDKHSENQGGRSPSVQAPPPASTGEAGDGVSSASDPDCAARKQFKKDRGPIVRIGQIIAGDGVEGHCLGEPITPEMITAANGCEPRGEWRLCRMRPWTDLFYDKHGRLDVIRVNRTYRLPKRRTREPRTPDGIGPGMSPDNVAWNWGMPLRVERVKDPDFGPLEIRYYHGLALEIERAPNRPTLIGGIYVFAMGRFPRLGPLEPALKDGGAKRRD
jgi:hypothetical protein